jgi:hypothetical protein
MFIDSIVGHDFMPSVLEKLTELLFADATRIISLVPVTV